MPNISNGVNFIWSGTNATIPTGWVRETKLDGKFLKGATFETNPGQNGGSTTHTHIGSSHTHTLAAHTHTVSLSRNAVDEVTDDDNDGASNVHTHANSTSGAVAGTLIGYATGTYSAISNDPPYYNVIFIKPVTYAQYLPNSVIYLYEDDDPEDTANHFICDGANSTPNMTGKFLKGSNAGADGGTTGGSTTNTHTIAHIHSHSHTHADSTSGAVANNTNANRKATDAGTYPESSHTHTIYIESNTGSLTTSAAVEEDEVVEPAYTKLLAVQNRTGTDSIRLGVIGIWIGTLSSIPSNYTATTTNMKARHLKITDTIGDIAVVGGSNTHSHSAYTHGYTVSHTHSGRTSEVGTKDRGAWAGAKYLPNWNHTHPVTTAASNLVSSNDGVSASSSNNEPEYKTVSFIKLNNLAVAGESGLLVNFL